MTTLTIDALLEMLQNAPDKTEQGIPYSRDHSLGLDFKYKRDAANVLRTTPLGIQVILDDDDKSGFVRVLHEPPALVPEHDALKRLGNDSTDFTHVSRLNKLNRRVRFKFGKKGQLLGAEQFVRKLHGLIVGRTHQCNYAFVEAREKKRVALSRKKVLTKVLRNALKGTGVHISRKTTMLSPYGGLWRVEGVGLKLPGGTILDIKPQDERLAWTGRTTQEHGCAVGVRFIALNDNPEAIEAIVKALAELARNSGIAIERTY